jgi:hypothetical protein
MINPFASEVAVAAVLMQNNEASKAHPVYYTGCLLTLYELKYTLCEKLAIALLFAYVKFKHYLVSSHLPIIVQYEQEGLKHVIQQTDPIGRSAKFIASL